MKAMMGCILACLSCTCWATSLGWGTSDFLIADAAPSLIVLQCELMYRSHDEPRTASDGAVVREISLLGSVGSSSYKARIDRNLGDGFYWPNCPQAYAIQGSWLAAPNLGIPPTVVGPSLLVGQSAIVEIPFNFPRTAEKSFVVNSATGVDVEYVSFSDLLRVGLRGIDAGPYSILLTLDVKVQ